MSPSKSFRAAGSARGNGRCTQMNQRPISESHSAALNVSKWVF